MKISDTKTLCQIFYQRFSTLIPDQSQYQLKFHASPESVISIVLQSKNEFEDLAAVLSITEDTVRILKIESYEDLKVSFVYDTPLELYKNLFTLMILCCRASRLDISVSEALNATLSCKIKTWRDLVKHICSLVSGRTG
jgi:hypothetical protein